MATAIKNTYGIKFLGLEKKPTYDELVNYIQRDPDKIKLPNREAKFLRNTPMLSQLDGEGLREMEEQQLIAMKLNYREQVLRQMSANTGIPHRIMQAQAENMIPIQRLVTGDTGFATPDHSERVERSQAEDELRERVLEHHRQRNLHDAGAQAEEMLDMAPGEARVAHEDEEAYEREFMGQAPPGDDRWRRRAARIAMGGARGAAEVLYHMPQAMRETYGVARTVRGVAANVGNELFVNPVRDFARMAAEDFGGGGDAEEAQERFEQRRGRAQANVGAHQRAQARSIRDRENPQEEGRRRRRPPVNFEFANGNSFRDLERLNRQELREYLAQYYPREYQEHTITLFGGVPSGSLAQRILNHTQMVVLLRKIRQQSTRE